MKLGLGLYQHLLNKLHLLLQNNPDVRTIENFDPPQTGSI